MSEGAYEQALADLSEVWRRALQADEKTWAAVVLWHCMIIAEKMGDWPRAVEYGERVLLLRDDAYVRLFLFRGYRRLGNEAKAAEHLRASVDLSDETRDQSFLETLVQSATCDEGAQVARARKRSAERVGVPAWGGVGTRRRPQVLVVGGRRGVRARDV
jgi:lipopolysaccharide biosynthesis regulator YciM